MKLRRYLPLFLALLAAQTAPSQTRIFPERLVTIVVPEVVAPRLFNGEAGHFIDVPDNAIRLEFQLTTAPREANVNLYVRFGQDVDRDAADNIVSDYQSRNPGGAEGIVITPQSAPALMGGRYFIAVESGFRNPQTFGFLEVFIELSAGVSGLDVIAGSDFETNSLKGWTRNFPDPDPQIPGSTTGGEDSAIALRRGPPDGSRSLQITTQGNDYFVLPMDYLGDLSLLGPNLRMEFDLAHIGDRPRLPLDLRVIGEFATYRWVGQVPLRQGGDHYVVQINANAFERLSGPLTFDEALRNVLRIEIRANYGVDGAVVALDNVVLLGRASPPRPPVVSPFERSTDGWEPNLPDAPFLLPRIFGVTSGDLRTRTRAIGAGGASGGYLQLTDVEDFDRDYVVAPPEYLGNLLSLGPTARLEFDRRHQSPSGSTRGVEVRVIGFGGAFAWIGPAPTREWTHYVVPLDGGEWTQIAGERTFEEVMSAVQRIEISMDELAGPEISGLDSVLLVVPPPLVPQLSADPQSLTFNSVQGQSAPMPKSLDFTSNGPVLEWVAAPSADAPWIMLPSNSGTTPGELMVAIDSTGLPAGVYTGAIEIAWAGSPRTITIPVTLHLASASSPLISSGGIVNSADFTPNANPAGAIVGGMYVSIFGVRMASGTVRASTLPLPTELNGTIVTFGGIRATIVFVSDLVLVVAAPQALTQPDFLAQTNEVVDVVVIRDGEASPPEPVRLEPVRPKLFSQSQTGSGPGAILNTIGAGQVQINTFENPAQANQAISLFGTGMGPSRPAVPDGVGASGLSSLTSAVRVLLGGRNAQVLYAGLSPGSPHLYQVDVLLPPSPPQGCEVPVQVFVEGVASNEVTAAITENGQPCQ